MKRLVKVKKDDRYNLIGTFDRFSTRYDRHNQRNIDYIIIKNIETEDGEYVTNYTSFAYGKTFGELDLVPGDIVSFRARIVACQSTEEALDYGFYNPQFNVYFRLMNPTKGKKLYSAVKRIPNNPCPINISNLVKG